MNDEDEDVAESGYDAVDYESHPSLSQALEEARNRYEDEEDRRRTIETKIGILISIDAIVISVLASFGEIVTNSNLLALFFALSSAAIGLHILWPRDYDRPGVDIEEIFGEAARETYEFEKQFLNDYRAAISTNIENNDDRYRVFKICAVLTFSSIGVVFLSQLPIC